MLNIINEAVLGPLLIAVTSIGGCYLLVKYRFKPLIYASKTFGALKNSKGIKTACLSLAGTLGVGNITGVTSAISAGGAGAIFWMWFFSIFACVIKYSEVILAHKYKGECGCSTAYYIEKGIKSKSFAILFSVMLLISSVGMGNMVQCASASDGLLYTIGFPRVLTGVIFSLSTLFLIAGGRDSVSRFTSLTIPMLSLSYVAISIAIIVANIRDVPSVISQIVSSAMSPKSLSGGVAGFLTSKAVRLGASRGILSNEAGCGTAAYAQDTNENDVAVSAVWGIAEVIIDTVILCSLTAFVVLIAPSSHKDGMQNVIASYSFFGRFGGIFIGISAGLYGLASVVCWAYYGMSAVKYLGGKKTACILYAITYSIAGLLGSVFRAEFVWEISDVTVSVMAILNTFCVLILSGRVKKATLELFN